MGEAKRRKQKLGQDYGKVPPVLSMGSQQFEKQLEQFMEAWLAHMEDLYGQADDGDEEKQRSEEESQALQAQTATWLADYFEPYRIQDRHKLVAGVLDPQYAQLQELIQAGQSQDSDIENVQKWMWETLQLYGMFKPHFSKSQLKMYGEPLRSFYDLALEEAKSENDEERVEGLRSLFAPCLES